MFGRYDGKPLIFWFGVRDSVGVSFPLHQAYHQVECPRSNSCFAESIHDNYEH